MYDMSLSTFFSPTMHASLLWGFVNVAGLPNGQLPVLEIDGYVLPQSMAILRYVGKLGGKDAGIFRGIYLTFTL